MRPSARLASVVSMSAIAVAGLALPASAHALLLRSTPAEGAIVDRAPSQVVLTFTEPPDPQLSAVSVLDARAHIASDGKATVDPTRARTLTVPLRSGLPNGIYTVKWQTTSTVDGHTTAGFYSFGVGVSPAGAAAPRGGAPPTTRPPSAASVAGRWLLYWGMAVLLATALMRFLVLRSLPRGWRIVLAAAWGAAAIGLLMLAYAEGAAAGVSTLALLRSATGSALIRQGIALLATGAAVTIALRRPTDAAVAAVGVGAAAGLLLHALGGHAGAERSWGTFNVAVQWLHLVSVSIWIGGLAWLLVELRRPVEESGDRIRRFSTVAAFALGAVVVTGVLRAVDLLGGWTDLGRLLTTGWGNALLWKLGLFVALVGLAAWNRYVNVRNLDAPHTSSLRRFVGGEVLLAAGIFGVTGILAGLPPAADVAAGAAPPQRIVAVGHDFATTTVARLTVTPGTVGQNRFDVTITDFDTHRPIAAARVGLRFTSTSRPDLGAATEQLRRSGPGEWTGTSTALSIAGGWRIVAVVQTEVNSTEVPVSVHVSMPPPAANPTPSGEQTSVSRAPGQPDIYTITLVDGSSVQAYLDPATQGPSEVHFTAFDPSGNELPIDRATASAASPSGPRPVKLRRLSAGHFVGDLKLTPGAWTFSLHAVPKSGAPLSVSFRQEIG
jgi:copper transport protein